MKGEFNYRNLIEILDMWLTHSHIPFRRIQTNSHEKYILQHDLGKKYSIYIHTAVVTLLNEVDCMSQNSNIDENTLTFEICTPDES